MSEYEAATDMKPQIKKGTHTEGRIKAGYFAFTGFLILTVVLLCTNNFIMYKSYKNFHSRYITAYNGMKAITAEKSSLALEKDRLLAEFQSMKIENNELRKMNRELLARNEEILGRVQEISSINQELDKKNKELTDDNIALQNTLKKAASVGIKPQSYTSFEGLSSRGELDRGRYMGKFLGTAYTPSAEECGNNRGITNSGKPIIPGISVAVDSRHWPFGTVFYIKGLGYAVAMDTGGAIKGRNRFDFAVFDRKFAMALGSKQWDVYLIKLGDGTVKDLDL